MTLCMCMCVLSVLSVRRLLLERYHDVLLHTSTPSWRHFLCTANRCTYLLRLTHRVLVCNLPLFALFLALGGRAIFVALPLGIGRQASGDVCEPPWFLIFGEDRLAASRLELGLWCSALGRQIASVDPIQEALEHHVGIWLRVQTFGWRMFVSLSLSMNSFTHLRPTIQGGEGGGR